METTDARSDGLDPAAQLRELERAEALPYVVYPPTPWWYMPTMGLLFGAIVVVWANQALDRNTILTIVAFVVIATCLGAISGFIRTRYGAFPKPYAAGAPTELRSLYQRYLVGALIVIALVTLVWWSVGPYGAAGATFVLVTASLTLYEVVYARVAAGVRARLGIEAA